MAESYQELLLRHERERLECRERERRENMMVTVQASNLGGPEEEPYTIEIIFPNNLNSREKQRVCMLLHQKLGEEWLSGLGYKFAWLTTKAQLAYEAKEKEKEESKFR